MENKRFFVNLRKCVLILLSLTLIIFIKVLLFHYFCFHSIPLTVVITQPMRFWVFYLPKIAASLMVASFCVLCSCGKKIIILFINLVLDAWIIANLIYFRSYNSFLDVFSLMLASNMDGFWESVLFFFKPFDLLFVGIDCVYYICIKRCEPFYHLVTSIVGIICAYIISVIGLELFRVDYGRNNYITHAIPHYYSSLQPELRRFLLAKNTIVSVSNFSILHSIGFIATDLAEISSQSISLSKEEIVELHKYEHEPCAMIQFGTKMIIVIFESWETWTINPFIMPNLCSFMNTHNLLYSRYIQSQVGAANSMDGQMIINTGLLPIKHGATPMLFPNNTYPSIAEYCAGNSVTVVPHDVKVWNQGAMSMAFHYDTTMVSPSDDTSVIEKGIECINQGYQLVQIITIDSHAPFTTGSKKSKLNLRSDMPQYLADYIRAINYTDECLCSLFSAIDSISQFSNVTLVMTGDHTIFYPEIRKEYNDYSVSNDLGFEIKNGYCPLVICDNSMKNTQINQNINYQMDIFPTMLDILNCEENYWRGFGISLLDSVTMTRTISVEEAQNVSDLMIRGNYFEKSKK